ncbi:uncharacterized protein G2W53_013789 [Senna tora]|uniref:Uncharacterized protein n=1 Tax=Senna tora TaxID=362788 RepID=A0A834WPQ3_9FABA|nr:uncharacterized protein G2W53_013773 [Senna tora]KAF7831456.1 uncharacterized protein G2W53_013789 [Senna tora]
MATKPSKKWTRTQQREDALTSHGAGSGS